jgi:hypothetical protein
MNTARQQNEIIPRWLSLRLACQYCAIGEHRLKELARQGDIKGFQDPGSKRGDWIFDRLSLDDYRGSQATIITTREKALAIMKGVRL